MKLIDICSEIIKVEEGMMYGTINFECNDDLMFAMKMHPAEELDAILEDVYMNLISGKKVSPDSVKTLLQNVKNFSEEYRVKALAKPIAHLEKYMSENY